MKNPRTPRLLWRSSARFFLEHPWHFALSVLGVALGVSVVVSIDLANSSAKKAFSLSTEAITGKATHQIVGTTDGLDESVYRKLRIEGKFRKTAPVVEGFGRIDGMNRTFRILGIDPIAEAPFRDFASQKSGIPLSDFITGDHTGIISASVADEMGLSQEDTIHVSAGGHAFSLRLAGIIHAADERTKGAMENLLIVDIGIAQKILKMQGRLSRIDLILPEIKEDGLVRQIESFLPEGSKLIRSDTRTKSMAQMVRAFEFNLQALSMLALLVGMFLIYNTMSFSVVQRRQLIGRLRAMGVTRREILFIILREAAIIGTIGTFIGILVGFLLARILLKLVTRSMNDLYFVVSVQELSVSMFPLVKAVLLGWAATLIASYWPARDASQAEVSTVLKRSSTESRIREKLWFLTRVGIFAGLIGAGILFIPKGGIPAGYVSLLLIIGGFSLTIPLLITGMVRVFHPLLGYVNGLIGKMSVQGIATELSRTSVAVSALVVAVAATVGVGVMVSSFRVTVVSWLEAQLQADIYVQPPRAVARKSDAELDHTLVELLKSVEGVADFHTVRSVDVHTDYGTDHMVAIDLAAATENSYQMKKSEPNLWQRFAKEDIVMVSEVYAYRHHVQLGDSLFIETDRGRSGFLVAGIHFDYASDMGTISISRRTYDHYFDDKAVSGLALYATKGTDIPSLVEQLREKAKDIQEVMIQSNRGLREASIEVFDRTFTVTVVLRMLVMLVAFIGILSALMAIQIERSREHAVMRANGMTPGQLRSYVIVQTGVMGMISGILALPLGIVMAWILVYVINIRSFGWTLQFIVPSYVLWQALGLAVLAALLAGIYPSFKMSRANPAEALRND